MARDDFNRRRLRGMYERNKRRVSALADARDRRRDSADDELAPRRYIVSEHRTRVEGFGRGGHQVRRVVRIIERRPRGSRRFSDRGLFRRGGRDRFVRDDDFDREIRRERGRDIERRRRGGRAGERGGERRRGEGGSRFGVSRRLRLRQKELKEEQRRRGGRRGGNGNNSNSGNSKDGGRRGGGRRGERGGDKGGRHQPQQPQQQKKKQTGGRGGRARDGPVPTHADLDRQLDNYRGH